ncbi:MAG: FtsW/RodA/SpoVE family cell cycle protein [Patescibacteria group bacterium]|nr:FtsW/RodA/SpoVE family cell cycle protein [Patescibacteria group bacterium]
MDRWLKVFSRYDWSLMFTSLMLVVIGFLSIYGINLSQATDFFQFKKQLLAVGLGLVAMVAISYLDYRHIMMSGWLVYAFGFILLILALIVGKSAHGGGRWFVVGSLSFQPVELAKVTMAVFLASYVSRHSHKRMNWTIFIGSGVALLGYLIPVLLQPDFGSGMVLLAIWGATVVFCGLPRRAWWILFITALVSSTLLWNFGLKPYQRDRLVSFVDPAADPLGAAYNVTQARIAIGSGGFFGKGIGEGSQARLRFLPEASTDFMFAVVGEELGFLGLLLVLGLFGYVMWRMLRIGMQSSDAFGGILAVAFCAFILFHLLVNAGMNLGLMPVTGIPLPFLSAAASSIVTMFIVIGLVQSVAVHGRKSGG